MSDQQRDTSLLDSVITVYDQNKRLIARNDNYFSQDSFLELQLEAGTYYVAVTSKGNTNFDPNVEDSGMGGTTEGEYQLRMNFTPRPSQVQGIVDTSSTLFDGDADGRPGGVFDFWFRTQQDQGPAVHNIFVDKAANIAQGTGSLGSITNPYTEIDQALADAEPGDIVRIVGNGTVPNVGQPDNRLSYNIGTDDLALLCPMAGRWRSPRASRS